MRLTALRKELVSSGQPISIVCKRCGFCSESHPKKLFRRRYKMTMSDYRNHAQARKHRKDQFRHRSGATSEAR